MSNTRRTWVTQMLAATMVRRIVEALPRQIRVAPVKGVLVSRLYYDDISERPLSDCDVVVDGMSTRSIADTLLRDGWRVAAWSNDPHVVDLTHPSLAGIHADVHTRPLPVGYGAVTSTWLLDGAREDTSLFGVRVYIPDARRLLVHLVGNILRDHVVGAFAHTPRDVVQVLARGGYDVHAYAEAFADARLRVGAWTALTWIATHEHDANVVGLRAALRLSEREQRYATWRMSQLHGSNERIWERAVARCAGDDPRDAVAGAAAAIYGVLRAAVLRINS